jgi:TRAP transporter TAXI family solute receptor
LYFPIFVDPICRPIKAGLAMRDLFALMVAVLLCMVSFFCPPCTQAGPEKTSLIMGAKRISGPYYPTAGAIAEAFNRQQSRHKMRITVRTNHPSTAIVASVLSGELDFGVAHSHRIHQANFGLGPWDGRPQTALRSVLKVQSERIAIVAPAGSGMRTISDLKGRRVLIGAPHSDLHATAMQILQAGGMAPDKDVQIDETTAGEGPGKLMDGAIDAFFYIMGTMNRPFLELAADRRGLWIVSIAGPGIDRLIAGSRYLEKVIVRAGMDPAFVNPSDTEIIGVKAGLITSTRVPDRTVYEVAKEVFRKFDHYKGRYPATVTMTQRDLAKVPAAPLHPGAAALFEELRIEQDVFNE